MTAPHPVAAGSMTIEELGERAGITTRTIRSYQTIGMLPGPRKVGRVGYYTDAHLDRLESIGRLMQRGFSLASIAALFHAYEQGLTLRDVLGIRGADRPEARRDRAGGQGGRPEASTSGVDGVIDLR